MRSIATDHASRFDALDGARHLDATPTAGWGLHRVDVNGALGNSNRRRRAGEDLPG